MKLLFIISILNIFVNYSFSQNPLLFGKQSDIKFSIIKNQNFTPKTKANHNLLIKSMTSISPIVISIAINNSASTLTTPYNIRNRTLISGALFATTLATGFWLSTTEKPYNTILLTGHKLSSLSNIALIDVTLLQKRKHFSHSKIEKNFGTNYKHLFCFNYCDRWNDMHRQKYAQICSHLAQNNTMDYFSIKWTNVILTKQIEIYE